MTWVSVTVMHVAAPGGAESTMSQQIRKPPKTAFQPGCAPGPGRPPGARNKLSELALQALGDDFAEHGPDVIKKVRETRPHHYLSIVASLLPGQLTVEKLSPLGELSDEELAMMEELLTASRAKLVQQHNGAAIALEPTDTKQEGK
jgi:hypothetical protein